MCLELSKDHGPVTSELLDGTGIPVGDVAAQGD
jgi:hypothetical protein